MARKRSPIYGCGINDAGYAVVVTVNGRRDYCPYYLRWVSMITRCYSSKSIARYPTYSNTKVCDEWLIFSNFKSWMEKQDWQGKELDKDLIGDGILYSPQSCVFISGKINQFMNECKKVRGDLPLGVSGCGNRYLARVKNSFTGKIEHLGVFDTPTQAHIAWKSRKLELAKLLAKEQSDQVISDALIKRYSKPPTQETEPALS